MATLWYPGDHIGVVCTGPDETGAMQDWQDRIEAVREGEWAAVLALAPDCSEAGLCTCTWPRVVVVCIFCHTSAVLLHGYCWLRTVGRTEVMV